MALNDERIAIIGGGAAGLAAAIVAARSSAVVDVFESRSRVGESIKVTGDGRCNIGNARTSAADYFNRSFVDQAFKTVSPEEALAFLKSLGLLLREEPEGRLYPFTNKSTSAIDALRLAGARCGVRERCDMAACSVRRSGSGRAGHLWRVVFSDGSNRDYRKVVLACGGNAPRDLLPEDICVARVHPLLGPLATDADPLRGLDKVRAKCVLTANGHREEGEVTFRSYGVSGIAAFNMTRFVQPGDALQVDFLPGFDDGSLVFLHDRLRATQPRTWLEFTCGMLLPLVSRAVLRAAGLNPDESPTHEALPAFHRALRAFPLEVRGIGDKRLCQVHRGGVSVNEVDPSTMRIRKHEGLYVAGEMLDVDGPCGGYNLHWAWVSGIIAGRSAARD